MAYLGADGCACGRGCGPGSCPVSRARLGEPTRLAEVLQRFGAESGMRGFNGPRFSARYFVWGQGPALVLGHGLSDSLESFLPLAHLLTDRFTCIGWDLPATRGEGLNRLPWIRHRDLADHLVALLGHLGVKRAHLMGCSFGSTVALDALYRYPGLFDRGILQGGFAHRPLSGLQRWLVRLARFARRPVMRQMPNYELFFAQGEWRGIRDAGPGLLGSPGYLGRADARESGLPPGVVAGPGGFPTPFARYSPPSPVGARKPRPPGGARLPGNPETRPAQPPGGGVARLWPCTLLYRHRGPGRGGG